MNKLMTDTIKISPTRVYQCNNVDAHQGTRRMMARDKVWKDHAGKFHCGLCGDFVEDKTNTETGKSFIQVLSL